MDVYLLAQQLNRILASVYSLQMATRYRLSAILSAYKALQDLGIFAFVALYLFSAGGRHLSVATDLLRLINRMEKLHTKEQVMIASPHLSTTLLYDVSWWWII